MFYLKIHMNKNIFSPKYSILIENQNVPLVVSTILSVINTILTYTSFNYSSTQSKFDIPLQNQFSEESTKDSFTYESDDNNDEEENIQKFSIDELDIEEIIELFISYMKIDETCLTVFMIYLDRILKRGFILSQENVNRVVSTGIILAHKYLEDNCYKNSDYAKIVGISSEELLSLEIEFSNWIEFDFYVKEDYFSSYLENLKRFKR